jgi:hypothetical protein
VKESTGHANRLIRMACGHFCGGVLFHISNVKEKSRVQAMSRKNKITKDTVSEGFSVPLALTDMIPVVFFGLSAVRIGSLFRRAAAWSGCCLFE